MKSLKILGIIALFFFANKIKSQNTKLTYFQGSLAEATALAKKENKQVLAEFYATWCSKCIKFKAKTLSNEMVIKTLNERFIFLEVDGEKREKAFVASQKMKSYPQLFLFDSDQKILNSDKGYLKADELLKFINSKN